MKIFRLIIGGVTYDVKVPWERARERKTELRRLEVQFIELN